MVRLGIRQDVPSGQDKIPVPEPDQSTCTEHSAFPTQGILRNDSDDKRRDGCEHNLRGLHLLCCVGSGGHKIGDGCSPTLFTIVQKSLIKVPRPVVFQRAGMKSFLRRGPPVKPHPDRRCTARLPIHLPGDCNGGCFLVPTILQPAGCSVVPSGNHGSKDRGRLVEIWFKPFLNHRQQLLCFQSACFKDG